MNDLKSFEDLGVSADIVKGLTEMGITKPTEIQAQALPVLLNEHTDFVGQAQTGTGKTAAFGLPIIQTVDGELDEIQALVLCPTRELAQQIGKQLFKYTKYTNKIFIETVYGGVSIDDQISRLHRPTQVVVATPGRLIDLLGRKAIDLSNVDTLVLDEADEMISMGFQGELETILKNLKKTENKWLFSATLPEGVNEIIDKYLSKNHKKITVSDKQVVNVNISHQYIVCEDQEKLHILHQFLKATTPDRGIIFCKTRKNAQLIAQQLKTKNISTDALHGELGQRERDKVMRAFKNETLRVLVATDIAARGIDVPNLPFVVHLQLPEKGEYYTHRSGRTARGGEKGLSLVLANTKEIKEMRYFERALGISFTQLRPKK
ncbi:MAG: ATP-dependent RNA helicase DeaD [Psychromonas sp.]